MRRGKGDQGGESFNDDSLFRGVNGASLILSRIWQQRMRIRLAIDGAFSLEVSRLTGETFCFCRLYDVP